MASLLVHSYLNIPHTHTGVCVIADTCHFWRPLVGLDRSSPVALDPTDDLMSAPTRDIDNLVCWYLVVVGGSRLFFWLLAAPDFVAISPFTLRYVRPSLHKKRRRTPLSVRVRPAVGAIHRRPVTRVPRTHSTDRRSFKCFRHTHKPPNVASGTYWWDRRHPRPTWRHTHVAHKVRHVSIGVT